MFVESVYIEVVEDILVLGNVCYCELLVGNEIIVGKGNLCIGYIIGGCVEVINIICVNVIGVFIIMYMCVQVGFDLYLEEKIVIKEQEYMCKVVELDCIIKQQSYYKFNFEKVIFELLYEISDKCKVLVYEVKVLLEEVSQMKEGMVVVEDVCIIVVKVVYEGMELCIGYEVWLV